MKVGRKRKPEADRRTEVLRTRATKDETDAAYRLARRLGCTLAELLHGYLQHLLDAETTPIRVFVAPKCRTPAKGRMLRDVAIH